MSNTDLTAGLLRSLARELDREAEASAAACNCEGHYARQQLAADLAAQYRTRALRYEADPDVAARKRAHDGLMRALENAHALALRRRQGGAFTSREVFAGVAEILNAYESVRAADQQLAGK